ncbi:MAG: type I restriction enzyme HsdR N-terminal domain-containing protein [Planctomycetaceae bacterium]|jgi:16S rRNA G966 N2-methylase RsmD|nr:type I restriction enzyme HsdR N-terminal domain-containing protein [Planctomycetaceae bacterium]
MSFPKIFGDVDFNVIALDPDFKEASVREAVIAPILKKLGYNEKDIHREPTLFIHSGSKKKSTQVFPDYVITIGEYAAFVIEAKSPKHNVFSEEIIEQAFSYAVHPTIRSVYFVVCNGVELALFRTDVNRTKILSFLLKDFDVNWDELKRYLGRENFQIGGIKYDTPAKNVPFDYAARPLLKEIPVKKQAAKRHFGVHGYFTKQSWNVVAAYIENFSQQGDLVLDPFGGSGITAIEAMMLGRKAIHIDINPLANFVVGSLAIPVNQLKLADAFKVVLQEYIEREPKTKNAIDHIIRTLPGPTPVRLPKDADVRTADRLFSKKQIAHLSLIKSIILKQKNKSIRQTLLLMFSGLVSKINLTYHQSSNRTAGRGNASAFQYYRYRLAPKSVDLNVAKYFLSRYKKVLAAKDELKTSINSATISNLIIKKGTATKLSFLKDESIDYIYTDPPYGKKIAYLDLSAMWNAWLDLEVSEKDYELEAIEGGEHQKSKESYNQLIAESIREMYRVLKYDRWLSFVFAHKDPEFWHLIIDTAENCGFEYAGAVPQKNGQTSFKKRQNPFTILSGQLIINFRKTKNPKTFLKANLGTDIDSLVIETIEGVIAKNDGATLEQINDQLILQGLELGFLDLLKQKHFDLSALLESTFDYDPPTELFHIRKNNKFQSQVPLQLRIRYYLLSYLRRMEREHKPAHTDEIILHIMLLLKNGTTPENQTILTVLENIAVRVGTDCWQLKPDTPSLFQ